MSSYLPDGLQIALKLVRESDSISRSSTSFCLSASGIAPSSALEFEAVLASSPTFSSTTVQRDALERFLHFLFFSFFFRLEREM